MNLVDQNQRTGGLQSACFCDSFLIAYYWCGLFASGRGDWRYLRLSET
jgi:hypothetical protein